MEPYDKVKQLFVYEETGEVINDLEALKEKYDELDAAGKFDDAWEEFRCSGHPTGLTTERWSRNYESEEVAQEMCDGSWVGWTYWYGGGKHGAPEEMEWQNFYEVEVREEVQTVLVFSRKEVEKK